ncbi:hypothetical protein DUI87_04431 [Hirundo rustica rustica]|uniref:Uncharacterized protein n=1 Tax=Hirundo rustica rustica TaxID=333673 RepID=A0A3M0KZ18_HIRRU|nr:hypothetical protein DUI87_04431 [Hirundo rustica rustica]
MEDNHKGEEDEDQGRRRGLMSLGDLGQARRSTGACCTRDERREIDKSEKGFLQAGEKYHWCNKKREDNDNSVQETRLVSFDNEVIKLDCSSVLSFKNPSFGMKYCYSTVIKEIVSTSKLYCALKFCQSKRVNRLALQILEYLVDPMWPAGERKKMFGQNKSQICILQELGIN